MSLFIKHRIMNSFMISSLMNSQKSCTTTNNTCDTNILNSASSMFNDQQFENILINHNYHYNHIPISNLYQSINTSDYLKQIEYISNYKNYLQLFLTTKLNEQCSMSNRLILDQLPCHGNTSSQNLESIHANNTREEYLNKGINLSGTKSSSLDPNQSINNLPNDQLKYHSVQCSNDEENYFNNNNSSNTFHELKQINICSQLKQSKSNSRNRTAFTDYQLICLEREFNQLKYLSRIDRIHLAQSLNLSEKQVKIWFQNRRVRWRKRRFLESK